PPCIQLDLSNTSGRRRTMPVLCFHCRSPSIELNRPSKPRYPSGPKDPDTLLTAEPCLKLLIGPKNFSGALFTGHLRANATVVAPSLVRQVPGSSQFPGLTHSTFVVDTVEPVPS